MFKKFALSITILFIAAQAAMALTARQIMEKNDALKQPNSGKSLVEMHIYRNGKLSEKKLFKLTGKKYGGLQKSLTEFLKPTQIKFLSHEKKGRDDDQWIKMSRSSAKRIGSQDKGKSFVHSHFFYEDLQTRKIDDYNYKLLGNATALGAACYKIESVKKSGEKVYSKGVLYIRKSDFVIVKIDLYQKGRLFKIVENHNIKTINGIITPMKVVMKLANGKGKTELIIKQVKYNVRVLDSMFNKNAL